MLLLRVTIRERKGFCMTSENLTFLKTISCMQSCLFELVLTDRCSRSLCRVHRFLDDFFLRRFNSTHRFDNHHHHFTLTLIYESLIGVRRRAHNAICMEKHVDTICRSESVGTVTLSNLRHEIQYQHFHAFILFAVPLTIGYNAS